MKEEYKKLLQLIENANNSPTVKIEELLKETVLFFDQIRTAYVKASKEEKQELMQMMNDLYLHLQKASKEIGQKAGMTDENLRDYAENPNNFSEEQWSFLQESKNKLHSSARKFSAALKERPAPLQVIKRKPSAKIKKRDWV